MTCNKNEVCTQVINFSAVFIFTIGILFNYAYGAQLLDPSINFDLKFWKPFAIIGCIIYLGNSLAIFINIYNNYRNRNYFDKLNIKNPSLMYLVCLPLLILILPSLILFAVRMSFHDNLNPSAGSSFIILSFCVMLLLTEVNNLFDHGEKWSINAVNYGVILYTITTMANYTIFQLVVQQSEMFMTVTNLILPLNFSSPFQGNIDKIFVSIKPFVISLVFIFGTICTLLLSDPLRIHYQYLKNNYKETNENNIIEYNNDNILTKFSTFVSIVLMLCFIISYVYYRTGDITPTTSNIILTISYLIGFVISIFLIMNVKDNSEFDNPRLMYSIFLSVGLFGQFVDGISEMHYYANIKCSSFELWSTMILDCFLMAQSFTQTILISLLIKKESNNINQRSALTHSVIFLFITNFVYLVLNFDYINKTRQENTPYFFLALYRNGFYKIGNLFCILYRVYSLVVIFPFIKKYCEIMWS